MNEDRVYEALTELKTLDESINMEDKLSPESALAEIISVLGQIPLTKDQHKYLDLCLTVLIGVIHQEVKDA